MKQKRPKPLTVKKEDWNERGEKMSYVLGLIDGEGCFAITMRKTRKHTSLPLRPAFSLRIHIKKGRIKESFKMVKEVFGVGKMYASSEQKGGYQYVIASFEGVKRVKRALREKPPIIKRRQFKLWSKGIDLWSPWFNRAGHDRTKARVILKLAHLRDEITKTRFGEVRSKKWTCRRIRQKLEDTLSISLPEEGKEYKLTNY